MKTPCSVYSYTGLMGTLRDLQFALQLKIEELRQRDALIDELELELDAKDDLIRRLQGELDRLRLSVSGQQRAPSVRERRRALVTGPNNMEPEEVLQNPPISYSKTQESQKLLEAALAENEFMTYLDRDQILCLVDSAYPITFKQGVYVRKEGDEGSLAYIVEEGKLEVSRAGQKLHIIEPRGIFEELALIHKHTCSTTVTALMNTRLWGIEGQMFQKIMMRSGLIKITQSLQFLRSVSLFCVLPEDVIMKVSDALEEVKVLEKQSGNEDNVLVSVFSRGDCFGERPPQGDDERSMSVVAAGDVTCLVIDREGSLDETAARFYTACVLEALSVLHSKDVIHRDLKPENVLLDQRGYAKLVQRFGCAKKLGSLHRAWSFCGSVGYQAPEVILHKGHGRSADLWAVGMLLYELLNGRPLFSGSEQLKVFTAVLKGIEEAELPKTISKTAAHLIKSLCRHSPTERLGQRNGVKDICKHIWFKGFDWDHLQKNTMTPPIIPNVAGVLNSGGSAPPTESQTDSGPVDDSDWDIDF
ncbi:cGMP-dependent protein kinase 1 [Triplophysa tibetana]|uniref:cGMP-dependent protein kinase n=1 Tax=Triplophysa tibetana TaxID=1572043 RepID=A0A5A9NY99_9TELE|nr:cGMP-dependent protein kinase 1 [Triplophysa tibetana]